MAETPPPPSSSHPPPPPPTPPSLPPTSDSSQYWCHQCDKRVAIETLPDQPDVICFECKNGFVELISIHHHHHYNHRHHLGFEVGVDDDGDDVDVDVDDDNQPAFGNEFLQVLRLIAQAARADDAREVEAREDDAPPLPPVERDGEGDVNDYLRIELDRWNENDDSDGDDDDDESGDENGEIRNQLDPDRDGSDRNHDDNEDDDDDDDEEEDGDEDVRRRQRRDVIRLQLRDFATRALSRQNRILDWAEILMGLEDHSIEFRFQVPGNNDGYVGNPGDYVDAAGYEALLQTLAESDSGKRGSPPAAKSVVEALPTVEVNVEVVKLNESEVCAICKDKVFNNENEIVKKLPCGHMYHEDCIVPWLGSRNTCPICRYELPTDDPEYEEDRKKRMSAMDTSTATSSGGAV